MRLERQILNAVTRALQRHAAKLSRYTHVTHVWYSLARVWIDPDELRRLTQWGREGGTVTVTVTVTVTRSVCALIMFCHEDVPWEDVDAIGQRIHYNIEFQFGKVAKRTTVKASVLAPQKAFLTSGCYLGERFDPIAGEQFDEEEISNAHQVNPVVHKRGIRLDGSHTLQRARLHRAKLTTRTLGGGVR